MTGPDVAVGLSDGDVARRVAEGKTNDVPTRAARSVSDIVRAYVFTLINAILSVLFVIVAATGWVQGRVIGDRRRLWRRPVSTRMAAGTG
jgi:cation-transporting P-type ATPase E